MPQSTTTSPRAMPPAGHETLLAPTDPALLALLLELEALAHILPPLDAPGPEASEEEQEAQFDNMPV